MSPSSKASPSQILAIREQWDAGTISVRGWADTLGCSPETVRRIGRRDTHRMVRAGQTIEGRHEQAAVADPLVDEPSPEAVAGSLDRLQRALDSQPASAREVDVALAELTEKGKEAL